MKKLLKRLGIALGALAVAVAGIFIYGCATAREHVRWETLEITYDLRYGPRGDAPGEGTAAYSNTISHVRHDGRLIHTHRTGQFYDLVRTKGTLPETTPVYLNIHGGAWSEVSDKDGEDFRFLGELARMGFVVVNLDYQMQEPIFKPGTGERPAERPGATFDDMLRDIDLCVSHVRNELAPSLGIKPRAVVIGGGSAGAHLSCLYAYDGTRPETLGLGLKHELPVAFAVNVVGPTDLASDDFARPILKHEYEFGSFFNEESADRMLSLFGYLVQTDLRSLIERGELDEARRRLKRYSPIDLIDGKTPPTVLAYCRVFPWSVGDGCVPASTFYDHCAKLKENGVPYAGDIRSWRVHGWLREDFTWWLLDRIAEFKGRYL